MVLLWPVVLLARFARAGAQAECPDERGNVAQLRSVAQQLFQSGRAAEADACLVQALMQVTTSLEALAEEAEAIRTYRTARRLSPTVASDSRG